jgi:mono/diheme cytochrome c family protein
VRLSEPYIINSDPDILNKLESMKDDKSIDLNVQLQLSLRFGNASQAQAIVKFIKEQHTGQRFFMELENTFAKNEETRKYGSKLSPLNEADRKLVLSGAEIFKTVCVSCHGPEGKGLPSNIGPPLIGNFKLIAHKDGVIKILLHGLNGPVDGATYSEVMPPMGLNDDEWIASVLSYIRFDLCMRSFPRMPKSYIDMVIVKPEMVKAVRASNKDRRAPWTWTEIETDATRQREKSIRDKAANK